MDGTASDAGPNQGGEPGRRSPGASPPGASPPGASPSPGDPAGEEASDLSPGARLVAVFTAPSRAFAAVDRRPGTWWQPLLIAMALSGLFLHAIYEPVVVPAQLEELAKHGLEGAELEQASSIITRGYGRILAYAAAVVGTPFAILVVALFAHLGAAYLLNGAAGFGRTWAVLCHAQLVSELGGALRIPLMLSQGSMEVYFGPAALLPAAEGEPGFVRHLLGELDLFTFWQLGVAAIGLAHVHRIRRGPAAGLLAALWAVWALGSAALRSAFAG
jgi:hypothetical protein